mmetsp:Transcript_29532/g.71332  ORF Transcript_29532/g.71332 Transcript_29532/m.71332 type:complete len:80 (-) Transcript_29532:997-1236(-)
MAAAFADEAERIPPRGGGGGGRGRAAAVFLGDDNVPWWWWWCPTHVGDGTVGSWHLRLLTLAAASARDDDACGGLSHLP